MGDIPMKLVVFLLRVSIINVRYYSGIYQELFRHYYQQLQKRLQALCGALSTD